MAMKGQHARTPYSTKMEQAVAQLVGEGYDAFNQTQLAALMGVKKTNAFRARLRQLVENGTLICWSYYTENGGLGNAYASAKLQQMSLPEGEPF